MHWADVVAEQLLKRGHAHRVASGTSISGLIHIGNAGDVIFADGIARALRERGARAEVLWIADDVDPLRAVPEQLPASFSEHLGKPVCALPDPEGCHGGFTDHFILPFLESLEAVGIKPIEKRGSRMYAAGEYDEAIRVAIEKAEAIREILVRVAKSKKAPGWLPFDPICENCGRIATTDATGLEGGKVRYRCGGGVAGKKTMEGCGNEGAVGLRHGKLTWRVEWAARWKILGVTCEPFGKEHSAAGGSYDTSKVIAKEVYGYEPPLPVLYEYILVAGAKMAKSKGNVMPLYDLLGVLPPEAIRFFYFRVDPNKHRDFDPQRKMLPIVEEYERAEAVVHGRASPSAREDADEMRRSWQLSQVDPGQPAPDVRVPFNHLITLAQVTKTPDEVLATLRRSGYAAGKDAREGERLRRKAELARAFLNRWVPPEDKFSVATSLSAVPLDAIAPTMREFLGALAEALEAAPWDAEALHAAVFEAAKRAGLEGKDGFRAVYLALIGKERGPRAGYFLASLDRTFVVRRFKDVAKAK